MEESEHCCASVPKTGEGKFRCPLEDLNHEVFKVSPEMKEMVITNCVDDMQNISGPGYKLH